MPFLTLERVKRSPRAKELLLTKRVRIYSGEWLAWWRPMACGYTDVEKLAGIFQGKYALALAGHCGPEKQIRFEFIS